MSAKQEGNTGVPEASTENLYTMSQAAQLKGVSYHTVSRAIRRGALPAERIGKMAFITKGDLQTWHPKYDRAPMQYRHRAPAADAQTVLIDLASGDRVQLASRLATLIELAETGVRELEIERTLILVCERLASVLSLRHTRLWRVDRPRTTATLLASNGLSSENSGIDLADFPRFTALVCQFRGAVVVDLGKSVDRVPGVLQGLGSVLLVPMMIGDRLFGFVAGDRGDSELELTAGELDFASAAVNHACLALALQDARLSALSSVQPSKPKIRQAASA